MKRFALLLALAACGGGTTQTRDAGPKLDPALKPSLQGPLAFDAGLVTATSGADGGRDELRVRILLADESRAACQATLEQYVELSLTAERDIGPGRYTSDGVDGGYAYVYWFQAPTRGEFSSAATVELENVDFTALSSTRGSFTATLAHDDGGTSTLSGRFDARARCLE